MQLLLCNGMQDWILHSLHAVSQTCLVKLEAWERLVATLNRLYRSTAWGGRGGVEKRKN